MRNILTIARRELGAYFNSPIAYIVIPAYLLVSGYLFFAQAFLVGEASLFPFFSLAPLLFIFFFPAVTMRLLAEEKRSKTIELLITMPVTDWQVIFGKFLGALGVLVVALGLTLAYAATLASMGELDWSATLGAYLGLLLLGSAYVAIGLMASSWTRHQVAASLITVGITFTLYIVGHYVADMPKAIAPIIEYVSIDAHFQNIARGVIDTRDIVYYFSLIGICLFLATQSLDSRRWR